MYVIVFIVCIDMMIQAIYAGGNETGSFGILCAQGSNESVDGLYTASDAGSTCSECTTKHTNAVKAAGMPLEARAYTDSMELAAPGDVFAETELSEPGDLPVMLCTVISFASVILISGGVLLLCR